MCVMFLEVFSLIDCLLYGGGGSCWFVYSFLRIVDDGYLEVIRSSREDA